MDHPPPHEDQRRGAAPERPTSPRPAEPAVTSSHTQRPQARCASESGTSSSWSPTCRSLLTVLALSLCMVGFHAAHVPPEVQFGAASCKSELGLGLEAVGCSRRTPPIALLQTPPGLKHPLWPRPEQHPAPSAKNEVHTNGHLSAPPVHCPRRKRPGALGGGENSVSRPSGGILQNLGPDVLTSSRGEMPRSVAAITSLCTEQWQEHGTESSRSLASRRRGRRGLGLAAAAAEDAVLADADPVAHGGGDTGRRFSASVHSSLTHTKPPVFTR